MKSRIFHINADVSKRVLSDNMCLFVLTTSWPQKECHKNKPHKSTGAEFYSNLSSNSSSASTSRIVHSKTFLPPLDKRYELMSFFNTAAQAQRNFNSLSLTIKTISDWMNRSPVDHSNHRKVCKLHFKIFFLIHLKKQAQNLI